MHDLTPDPAEIGTALLKLLATQQMMGHVSMTNTCRDYIDRTMLDAPAQFVWDVAVGCGPNADEMGQAARKRIETWAQETPWLHAVAEVIADSMV